MVIKEAESIMGNSHARKRMSTIQARLEALRSNGLAVESVNSSNSTNNQSCQSQLPTIQIQPQSEEPSPSAILQNTLDKREQSLARSPSIGSKKTLVPLRNHSLDACGRPPRPTSHLSPDREIILESFKETCANSVMPWSSAFSYEYKKKQQPSVSSGSSAVPSCHLFFDLKACIASICGPGESTELFFSIYNKSKGKFISEEYLVRLTFNGMPVDEDRIGRLYTIFTDISRHDVSSELFLVCRIIRYGRMLSGEKDTPSLQQPIDDRSSIFCRRPFGCAVLDLTSIFLAQESKEKEYLMKIYTASNEFAAANLYENNICKTGGYETSSRAEMICVSLEFLTGDLDKIVEYRYGKFGIPITQRLGFPEVIMPGDTRNSLYVTLVSGEFNQGRKTTAKNVEVALQVRLVDGQVLEKCVFVGSGDKHTDCFESSLYYHCNSPKWNERLRLDIPVESFDRGTHLFLTLRHCSSGDKGDKSDRAFAFAVLPLMQEDETVLANDTHPLITYKYDKRVVKDAYLSLLDSSMDASKFSPTKDQLLIRTELCSTRLTQSVFLLQLLRWKDLPPYEMSSVLKNFTFIGPVEIIKYLQDILDALFGILQSFGIREDSEMSHLVFSALSFVLNIVISDRRFANFHPILDVYIENHFNKGHVNLVWIQLLQCIYHLTVNSRDASLGKELRSALKAWECLFQFIVKSWLSDPSNSAELLRARVFAIFDSLRQLFLAEDAPENLLNRSSIFSDSASMTSGTVKSSSLPLNISSFISDGTLIGAQILVLQNLAVVFSDLCGTAVFSPIDLIDAVVDFVTPLPFEKRKLLEGKLQFCISLFQSPIVSDSLALRKLVDSSAKLVNDCLVQQLDHSIIVLVNILLQCILSAISADKTSSLSEYNLIIPMTGTLVDIYLDFDIRFQFDCAETRSIRKAEISTIIVSLLQLLTEEELGYFMSMSEDESNLSRLFSMSRAWLTFEHTELSGKKFTLLGGFPVNWLIIQDAIQSTILKISAVAANFLQQRYLVEASLEIAPYEFRFETWLELVNIIVKLLVSISDQMDSCANVESNFFLSDNRPKGARLISLIWFSLRSYHRYFLPNLIGPFVELTLCHGCMELQNIALGLLVEMIELEKTSLRSSRKSGLNSVEIDIIERLDHFVMTQKRADARYHQWLLCSLRSRVKDSCAFLQALDRFLSLTLFIRGMQTDEFGCNSLTSEEVPISLKQSVNIDGLRLLLSHLMQFTALLDRRQLFIKYLHQLIDINISQNDFAEAGWAINNHAELYDWTDEIVPAIDGAVCLESLSHSISDEIPPILKRSEDGFFLEGLLSARDILKLRHVQKSSERKELLYLLMIALFFKSQCFEHAISLCENLSHKYSKVLFDYTKLAKIHLLISSFAEAINNQQRFYPEYYRVAFVGKGWENDNSAMINVGGKQFVYRAKPWEKLGEFVDRMLAKYPGAKIMKSNSWPPELEFLDSPQLWMQICKVELVPDTERFPEFLREEQRKNIPPNVLHWYERNDSCTFTFSRPFKKATPDSQGNEEFLNLWTENYILKTEYAFPYFLKRSEITEYRKTESSPIENAIRNVEAKNRDLENLEREYLPLLDLKSPSDPSQRNSSSKKKIPTGKINCNPLTMSLNGAVDAPVNGGIPMYKKYFLDSASVTILAAEDTERLRKAIADQVQIIRRCILLHGVIAPAEMQPLHENIVSKFQQNFAEEIEKLSLH